MFNFGLQTALFVAKVKNQNLGVNKNETGQLTTWFLRQINEDGRLAGEVLH